MNPLQDFQKRPRVLVAGSGLTALETAARVLELGYETVFANPEGAVRPVLSLQPNDQGLNDYEQGLQERLRGEANCLYLEQARIKKVAGFAGDFQVQLQSANRTWSEAVGAVVLAPALWSAGPGTALPPGDVRQRSTLEALAAALESRQEGTEILSSLRSDSYVAFVLGLNGSGGLAEMAQALNAALRIREGAGAQVYFFTGNIKVAGENLERLYLTCRDAGVIFFKFEEELPEFRKEDDRVVIQFMDSLVGLPFEIMPDLLITDSLQSLPEAFRAWAVEERLGLDRSGFLQPANVHLLPHQTLREGIFAAGPAKGPVLPRSEIEEARGAALAVHHFFQGREDDPRNREVFVDKGLCTVCLTCLRFCPHQAIGWSHRVFIHPLACRRCGICASECPMDAIQIAGYADAEVEERLAALAARWEKEATAAPRIVVFGCQRSAGMAWQSAERMALSAEREEQDAERGAQDAERRAQSAEHGEQGAERGAQSAAETKAERDTLANPSPVAFIGLPCAGKLDTDSLLKALTLGADGVLVLACPEENCRAQHGNTYARRRLEEARDYLAEAGINPERLRFDTISSNMVHKLVEIIDRFSEDIKEDREEPGFMMGVME